MNSALVATACLVTSSGWAAEEAKLSASVSGREFNDPLRLTAYEDNYAVWNQMRNNGWTTKDEQALRAKISFKYTFCGPQFRQPTGQARTDKVTTGGAPEKSGCPTSGKWAEAEFYFGYTAEFDFYADTRTSDPVIGRVNAPGFFIRLPAVRFLNKEDWKETDALEIGLQHRSDGQATEVTSDRDARIANEQYASGYRPFFDTISRGANFLLIAVDKELTDLPIGDKLTLRTKLHLYLGQQESEITWGPLANRGRRFSDYDRLQLHAWWRLSKQAQFDLAWRLGDRGLATDSWTLGFEINVLTVPLYLRLHRGPMNTLSNYTQRQDSVGIGVRFAGY
jgi:outer membrane phospholipase A